MSSFHVVYVVFHSGLIMRHCCAVDGSISCRVLTAQCMCETVTLSIVTVLKFFSLMFVCKVVPKVSVTSKFLVYLFFRVVVQVTLTFCLSELPLKSAIFKFVFLLVFWFLAARRPVRSCHLLRLVIFVRLLLLNHVLMFVLYCCNSILVSIIRAILLPI